MPNKILEELAQKITSSIPDGLKQTQQDIATNVKLLIEDAMDKLNLINRNEFEIQQKILLKTREKLDALELKVTSLEQTLNTMLSNNSNLNK